MTDQRHDPATEAQLFWENHYRGHDHVFGNGKGPNPALIDVAASLPPGQALDLGSGEGRDALWLASRGWHVTAVDISATALHRAHTDAAKAGVEGNLTTEQHDLAQSFPTGTFDLISAQYFHTPLELPRHRVLGSAVHSLRPGGLLLVVDHGSVRPWAWNPDPDTHFPTPADVFAELDLDPHTWRAERQASPQREDIGPDGKKATVTDHVLTVRRLPMS